MEIGTILGYISEYGISAVIIALLIWLLITYVKKDKRMSEKMEEQEKKDDEREAKQQENTEKLYERLYDSLVKISSSPQMHTKEEEEENRIINNFIDGQLSCLIDENKANRAYVFLYHNGGKDIMGRSFQKMSITNEIVDANTVPIMNNYQNVPRSMFPTLFKTILAQDKLSINKIDDIKETDPVLFQMLQTHNVHAAYMRGIRRADGMVLGFVVIEYVSNSCSDITEAEKNLEKKTLRISGALVGKDN